MTNTLTASAPITDDLIDLYTDWEIHLRSERKSPGTIASYLQVARAFTDWLDAKDTKLPPDKRVRRSAQAVTDKHVKLYLAELADRTVGRGREPKKMAPATVAKHFRSLQQLFKWLTVVEQILDRDPMAAMKPPAVPDQPVPVLPDDEVVKLITSCGAAISPFERRRDEAIIRVFLDSGVRIGELVGQRLTDLDFEHKLIAVKGKGDRKRNVPFGLKTMAALRRYLRERRGHSQADSPMLWLGVKGPLTDSGVRQMLERRVKDAGIHKVWAHRFRHTFAHEWLASDGGETDLMNLAGWNSRTMVGRYAKSAAAERAIEAHQRKGLGDRY